MFTVSTLAQVDSGVTISDGGLIVDSDSSSINSDTTSGGALTVQQSVTSGFVNTVLAVKATQVRHTQHTCRSSSHRPINDTRWVVLRLLALATDS